MEGLILDRIIPVILFYVSLAHLIEADQLALLIIITFVLERGPGQQHARETSSAGDIFRLPAAAAAATLHLCYLIHIHVCVCVWRRRRSGLYSNNNQNSIRAYQMSNLLGVQISRRQSYL